MSVTVHEIEWKYVELGRVVLVEDSKLATIVEIIDQKRVCNPIPCVVDHRRPSGSKY